MDNIIFIIMALIPKITPYDTKIIPQMYKDGYIKAIRLRIDMWKHEEEYYK